MASSDVLACAVKDVETVGHELELVPATEKPKRTKLVAQTTEMLHLRMRK